jgi:PD-(D/E)XK nuclease superfamily protein
MGTHKGKLGKEDGEDARRVRGLTCKRRGEMVEAEFLAKVARMGFRVSKPWGDSDRYDFVVDAGSGFWRVQVKHTTCRRGDNYLLALAVRDEEPYTQKRLISWWSMLSQRICSTSCRLRWLRLLPWPRKSKFDRYREAWCLLACSRKARGWKDVPVLCRCAKLRVRYAVSRRVKSTTQPCHLTAATKIGCECLPAAGNSRFLDFARNDKRMGGVTGESTRRSTSKATDRSVRPTPVLFGILRPSRAFLSSPRGCFNLPS